MYKQFFGLKEKPFNVTSDPGFIFFSRRHKEAFSQLTYGIKEKKGFLAITGEIGTGKTTLCRALLNSLDEKTKTAFILNPDLSPLQLLEAIVEDFGIKVERRTKLNLFRQLNNFLIEGLNLDHNVVLIVDEAQNLKPSLLEEIRLLSNLETEKEKLFQIVLVGQPQLRKRLDDPSLKQLQQRIAVRYHILPLDEDEVRPYIYHRLKVAGCENGVDFSEPAISEIFIYAGGVPRLINLVCEKSLLLAFVLETKDISKEIIKKSVAEIEGNYEHN